MILMSTRVWHRERFQPLQVEVAGSKITALHPYRRRARGVLDLGDLRVLPGLVDIHCHGYGGRDANHATPDWLARWAADLPQEGVTGILAATSTAPEAVMLEGMRTVAGYIEAPAPGARILGIYSEGPLISAPFRGAQRLKDLVTPAPAVVDRYQEACGGHLRYCAIAPEVDQGLAAIRHCARQGIRVAIGHSGAGFELCGRAREAGAVSFAHTFNGMLGLKHREPGTVGAALYYEDMYAEVIGDGVHVAFPVVRILGRLKGKDRLILVTDSVQIKGLDPGTYDMPGRRVVLGGDGVGRLPDGTLAGSAARMNLLLGNLIEKAGLPEAAAVNAATCNPLRMLGLDMRKGLVEEGYDADLTILRDDYSVVQTYVEGRAML